MSHKGEETVPHTPEVPRRTTVESFQRECLGFFRFGKCPRKEKGKPCSFKHSPNTGGQKGDRGRSLSKDGGGKSKSTSPVPHTQTHSHSKGNTPTRSFTPNPR